MLFYLWHVIDTLRYPFGLSAATKLCLVAVSGLFVSLTGETCSHFECCVDTSWLVPCSVSSTSKFPLEVFQYRRRVGADIGGSNYCATR